MVNNIAKIRALLEFTSPNSFYFLEILKRRKENPDLEKHAKLIRDFYIYSLEEYDKLSEKVVELCDLENARAYFRLNVRDSKKIAFQYNKRLAELLITEDYKAIPRSYAAVVGEFQHEDKGKKKWLIDIDKPTNKKTDLLNQEAMLAEKNHLKATIKTLGGSLIAEIPTLNGLHLITNPFRMDIFRIRHPEVDVHKDNPTIMYAP